MEQATTDRSLSRRGMLKLAGAADAGAGAIGAATGTASAVPGEPALGQLGQEMLAALGGAGDDMDGGDGTHAGDRCAFVQGLVAVPKRDCAAVEDRAPSPAVRPSTGTGCRPRGRRPAARRHQ